MTLRNDFVKRCDVDETFVRNDFKKL